jgi:hypothetical protein
MPPLRLGGGDDWWVEGEVTLCKIVVGVAFGRRRLPPMAMVMMMAMVMGDG